jgi:hypothetical protein
MFMETGKLIDHLVAAGEPVRRLSPPWRRTAAWLMVAIPYVALVVLVVSPRGDLAARMSEPRFAIEQLAALSTAITAAAAAFATIIPGYDRKVLLLSALPAAVWLGSLGEGCVREWLRFDPDDMSLHLDWFCFPATVLVGAIPAIAMAAMLRRGAPLTPHATTALGGLAAAGLGNFGLRLFHSQDASLMVLVWQISTVIALSALSCWAGRYLLNWRSIIAMPSSEHKMRGDEIFRLTRSS